MKRYDWYIIGMWICLAQISAERASIAGMILGAMAMLAMDQIITRAQSDDYGKQFVVSHGWSKWIWDETMKDCVKAK